MEIKTPVQIRLTMGELDTLDTYIAAQSPFQPSRADVTRHALMTWLADQRPQPSQALPPAVVPPGLLPSEKETTATMDVLPHATESPPPITMTSEEKDAFAVALRHQGKTWVDVAQILNDRGIPPHSGTGKWFPNNLSKRLKDK